MPGLVRYLQKPGRGRTACSPCLRRSRGKASGRRTGEGIPSSSWQAMREKARGHHLPGHRGQWMTTRSLQRPAGVMQTGTGPGKGPSVCPCLLPQHREPRNKGTILSDLMPPSPAGSARWRGHQGVSIHYPPPQLLSPLGLDVGEVGVPCFVAMATPNSPSPPKHKERQISPPPPGRTWVWLGIFPWESSFLMHKPWHA